MSEASVRAAIKTILETVPGIGRVHDFDRWSRSWSRFLELMRELPGGPVNGWMISRHSTSETAETLGGSGGLGTVRVHHYEIRGIRTLDDDAASEHDFQALIEAVCDAFRARPDLDGACDSIVGPGNEYGVQVREVGVDDFDMDTLYHTCTLWLYAQETV